MGWGSNATHKCEYIHGYPQALRHFYNTKAHRGKKWLANERMLYNQRSHQYRIVASESMVDNEPLWFDMVLYDTPLVRYFRPVDGVEKVYLRGWDSRLAWSFLWHACGHHPNKAMADTEGNAVVAPFNPVTGVDYIASNGVTVPTGWSVVLHLRNGCVDRSQSAHRPVFSRVSSEGDKLGRAEFRKTIDDVVNLMVLRLPSLHAQSRVSERRGRPFEPVGYSYVERRALGEWVEGVERGEAQMDAMAGIAQNVYDTALSKRLYLQGVSSPWLDTSGADYEPLDAKSFRTSLLHSMSRILKFDRRTGRKELPQFPNALPRNYVYNN